MRKHLWFITIVVSASLLGFLAWKLLCPVEITVEDITPAPLPAPSKPPTQTTSKEEDWQTIYDRQVADPKYGSGWPSQSWYPQKHRSWP